MKKLFIMLMVLFATVSEATVTETYDTVIYYKQYVNYYEFFWMDEVGDDVYAIDTFHATIREAYFQVMTSSYPSDFDCFSIRVVRRNDLQLMFCQQYTQPPVIELLWSNGHYPDYLYSFLVGDDNLNIDLTSGEYFITYTLCIDDMNVPFVNNPYVYPALRGDYPEYTPITGYDLCMKVIWDRSDTGIESASLGSIKATYR